MKRVFHIIFVLTILFPVTAHSIDRNISEVTNQLSRPGVSSGRLRDEGFRVLRKAVREYKAKTNEEEILKLTMALLKKDPSNYASEIVYPLYKKNTKAFDKELKKLSPSDQKRFKTGIKIHENVLENGNG